MNVYVISGTDIPSATSLVSDSKFVNSVSICFICGKNPFVGSVMDFVVHV
jgi:hypothetical protein